MYRNLNLSIFLSSLVLCLLPSASIADQPPTVDLPLTRVLMFNSGVGFFEHSLEIEGNKSSELSFKQTEINDLLKSLVLQDLDGGRISTITYDSKDPITKTLRTFAVDLTLNPTLSDILQQLRGELVRVDTPDSITGSIVGVEVHTEKVGDDSIVNSSYLTLLTESGLKSIPIRNIGTINFQNPKINADFKQSLAVLALSRDQQKKGVKLNFLGEGKRRVRVGYIHSAPVWKTSYRLMVGSEQGTMLQGWAIVENTTDRDWKDVSLKLISGRPISFLSNLYDPLYTNRPTVETELFSSLRPKMYEQNLDTNNSPPTASPNATTPASNESPSRQAIQRALESVVSVHYEGIPLNQIAERLKNDFHINVVLDLNGLDTAGVEPSEQVNVALDQVPLKSVLNALLEPLELTFIIKNDSLLITDAGNGGASMDLRTYNVTDLINYQNAGHFIRIVQNTVFPDSWEENGGVGTIEFFPERGTLVVTQTSRAHEELESLLAQLRSQQAVLPPSSDAPPANGYIVDNQTRRQPGIGGGMGGGMGGMGGGGLGGQTQSPVTIQPAAPQSFADATSVISAAQGAKFGEMFHYTIGQPVSLDRQKSAMLPFVNQAIEAEKISIYDANVHPKYPLNGLKLKNTTALHLMQGPITIFDSGAYAGDAQIEDIAPGGTRLLSYAMDLETEVVLEASSQAEETTSVKLIKGTLQISKKDRQRAKYIIKNSGKEPKTLIIERPISRKFKLISPEKDVDKTRSTHRFNVAVPADATTEFLVVEEEPRVETVALGSLDAKGLQFYITGKNISDKIKGAIEELSKRHQGVAELDDKVASIGKRIDELTIQQDRIRQNMSVLEKTDDLYRRYVKTFGEQEDEIEKLRKESVDIAAKADEQRKEVAAYITDLTVE